MEKPEIIRAKIVLLEQALIESKKFHQYSLIINSQNNFEKIGFFKTGQMLQILELLYNGAKLQIRHEVYGEADVYMNPQKNRILVDSKYKDINENNICNYIIWGYGEWYINKE